MILMDIIPIQESSQKVNLAQALKSKLPSDNTSDDGGGGKWYKVIYKYICCEFFCWQMLGAFVIWKFAVVNCHWVKGLLAIRLIFTDALT